MENSNLEQMSERRDEEPMVNLDLIVSLRGSSTNTTNIGEILQKEVSNSQEKSLARIVDYMLDTREDETNPGYNKDETRLANKIKDWRASAKQTANETSPYLFQIRYLGRNNTLSEPIDPTRYISDYPDMLKEKSKRTDFEELRYNAVDLVAGFIPGAGK
mgnify:CR=1 FL=1